MPTILITGANRGIGFELTQQYLAAGWRVLACNRHLEKAGALDVLKQQYPDHLLFGALDVRDEKQIQALAHTWQAESIDILLNNAGIIGPHHIEPGKLNVNDWQELFLVNTIAPLLMAQAFVEQVARSDRKIIATVSSLMGSITDNQLGKYYYYRSSKAAVNAAMKSLAIDLHFRNIIGVVLHPGWVQTDMGGEGATLKVADSVAGIRQVLGQLTLEDSGKFFNYKGDELPW